MKPWKSPHHLYYVTMLFILIGLFTALMAYISQYNYLVVINGIILCVIAFALYYEIDLKIGYRLFTVIFLIPPFATLYFGGESDIVLLTCFSCIVPIFWRSFGLTKEQIQQYRNNKKLYIHWDEDLLQKEDPTITQYILAFAQLSIIIGLLWIGVFMAGDSIIQTPILR